MSRRLVALSATAIAGIYLAGYFSTQEAAGQSMMELIATPTATIAGAPAGLAAATPAVLVRQSPTLAPNATEATGYRDGTYQGTGVVRFGSVGVEVKINGGRISNVALTRVTISYPAGRIAGLPAQVVARQSVQVDRVTGATYSTQAFQQAVQQALLQARAGSQQ